MCSLHPAAMAMLLLPLAIPSHAQEAAPVPLPAPVRLASPVPLDLPAVRPVLRKLELAFRHAGVAYTVTYLPPERAAVSFKAGLYDGDIARGANFSEVVPDAVRVDPPLTVGEFLCVSRSDAIRPRSWAGLARYRFGYRRGSKIVESRTREAGGRQPIDSERACLGMLRLGRLDACVGLASELRLAPELKDDPQLRVTSLAREASYLWLGPRHRQLAQRLSAELARLELSNH